MAMTQTTGTTRKPRATPRRQAVAPMPVKPVPPSYADTYDDILPTVQATLKQALERSGGRLFRTSVRHRMYETYLTSFPEDRGERQYHRCRTCESFLRHYGDLVIITPEGHIESALWDSLRLSDDHPYLPVLRRLEVLAESGTVEDLFEWDSPLWGQAEAGGFTHFSATAYKGRNVRKDLNAEQVMAENRENRKHLEAALEDLTLRRLREAKAMLQAGSLDRPEKILPMADFLIGVHEDLRGQRRVEARNRRLWLAVAKAAPGWCTPRGSALGALIKDIDDGLSMAQIARAHNERLDPTKYQRPTAPVKEGNVAQAEGLIQRLGIESALHRRFALASEVEAIWRPSRARCAPKGGVFGHLLAGQEDAPSRRLTASPVHITFARFRREVLPSAREIVVRVPAYGDFYAFTTQTDPEAPPILQWDHVERRNPFAGYLYSDIRESSARNWNLTSNTWVRATGLSLMAHMWHGGAAHQGEAAVILMESCRDLHEATLGLFPETLKSDLHAVRSTIEAYSKSRNLDRPPAPGEWACGLLLAKNMREVTVRVSTPAGVAEYVIDRWD